MFDLILKKMNFYVSYDLLYFLFLKNQAYNTEVVI